MGIVENTCKCWLSYAGYRLAQAQILVYGKKDWLSSWLVWDSTEFCLEKKNGMR